MRRGGACGVRHLPSGHALFFVSLSTKGLAVLVEGCAHFPPFIHVYWWIKTGITKGRNCCRWQRYQANRLSEFPPSYLSVCVCVRMKIRQIFVLTASFGKNKLRKEEEEADRGGAGRLYFSRWLFTERCGSQDMGSVIRLEDSTKFWIGPVAETLAGVLYLNSSTWVAFVKLTSTERCWVLKCLV